ncbi:MAG: hypothetical protein EOO40_02960 [Deltaproteobacteria bacterium]|nr:MAG: hypothetical protein EOO40_02960 [Deltaproteobacteria bacterium]
MIRFRTAGYEATWTPSELPKVDLRRTNTLTTVLPRSPYLSLWVRREAPSARTHGTVAALQVNQLIDGTRPLSVLTESLKSAASVATTGLLASALGGWLCGYGPLNPAGLGAALLVGFGVGAAQYWCLSEAAVQDHLLTKIQRAAQGLVGLSVPMTASRLRELRRLQDDCSRAGETADFLCGELMASLRAQGTLR